MILVCLHGWGGSKESFDELREELKDSKIQIASPDLPGFGQELDPPEPLTVSGYAQWVIEWMAKKNLDLSKGWMLLGHSHGGRIAIKLVTEELQRSHIPLPSHLFLCAAAGIRRRRHFKRVFGLSLAKIGKTFFGLPGLRSLQPIAKKLLYKLVRVHDYEKASAIMAKTMVNVTKEDLRPLLKNIKVPTDLFWGTDDGMTPFADAKIMEQEIPDATLHSFPGVHHRVHRDRADEIAKVIQMRVME